MRAPVAMAAEAMAEAVKAVEMAEAVKAVEMVVVTAVVVARVAVAPVPPRAEGKAARSVTPFQVFKFEKGSVESTHKVPTSHYQFAVLLCAP